MKVNIDVFNGSDSENIIEVEVTPKDCWSLDYVLAQVIHAALVEFRSDLHSSAHVDNADVPEALQVSVEDEYVKTWMPHWEYVLDEMIWGFGQIKNSEEDEPTDYHSNEWREYHQRINNATRLFGKYFQNLWN